MSCYIVQNPSDHDAMWGDCCRQYGIAPAPMWITGVFTSITTLGLNYAALLGWKWVMQNRFEIPIGAEFPTTLVFVYVWVKALIHFVVVCVRFSAMQEEELKYLTNYQRYFGFAYLQFENLALYEVATICVLVYLVAQNRFDILVSWVRREFKDKELRAQLKEKRVDDIYTQDAVDMQDCLDRVHEIVPKVRTLMFELNLGKFNFDLEELDWDSKLPPFCDLVGAQMKEKVLHTWKEYVKVNDPEQKKEIRQILDNVPDFENVVLLHKEWRLFLSRLLEDLEETTKWSSLLVRSRFQALRKVCDVDGIQVTNKSVSTGTDLDEDTTRLTRVEHVFTNREAKKQEMENRFVNAQFGFLLATTNALTMSDSTDMNAADKAKWDQLESLVHEGDEINARIRGIRISVKNEVEYDMTLLFVICIPLAPIFAISICYFVTHAFRAMIIYYAIFYTLAVFIETVISVIRAKWVPSTQTRIDFEVEAGAGKVNPVKPRHEFADILHQCLYACVGGTSLVFAFTMAIRYGYIFNQLGGTMDDGWVVAGTSNPITWQTLSNFMTCPDHSDQEFLANFRRFQLFL